MANSDRCITSSTGRGRCVVSYLLFIRYVSVPTTSFRSCIFTKAFVLNTDLALVNAEGMPSVGRTSVSAAKGSSPRRYLECRRCRETQADPLLLTQWTKSAWSQPRTLCYWLQCCYEWENKCHTAPCLVVGSKLSNDWYYYERALQF